MDIIRAAEDQKHSEEKNDSEVKKTMDWLVAAATDSAQTSEIWFRDTADGDDEKATTTRLVQYTNEEKTEMCMLVPFKGKNYRILFSAVDWPVLKKHHWNIRVKGAQRQLQLYARKTQTNPKDTLLSHLMAEALGNSNDAMPNADHFDFRRRPKATIQEEPVPAIVLSHAHRAILYGPIYLELEAKGWSLPRQRITTKTKGNLVSRCMLSMKTKEHYYLIYIRARQTGIHLLVQVDATVYEEVLNKFTWRLCSDYKAITNKRRHRRGMVMNRDIFLHADVPPSLNNTRSTLRMHRVIVEHSLNEHLKHTKNDKEKANIDSLLKNFDQLQANAKVCPREMTPQEKCAVLGKPVDEKIYLLDYRRRNIELQNKGIFPTQPIIDAKK